MIQALVTFTTFSSAIFHAAIFGFFYAWICSTMWGLDTLPAEIAITAMQAMNSSVRNPVFAPAFFGTPFLSLIAGVLAFWSGHRKVATSLFIASAVYLAGGLGLTVLVNVPMNEELARVTFEHMQKNGNAIWLAYSGTWQFWNSVRTIFSGLALLSALTAIHYLERARA